MSSWKGPHLPHANCTSGTRAVPLRVFHPLGVLHIAALASDRPPEKVYVTATRMEICTDRSMHVCSACSRTDTLQESDAYSRSVVLPASWWLVSEYPYVIFATSFAPTTGTTSIMWAYYIVNPY